MADEKKGHATRESVDAWFTKRQEANRLRRENPIHADDVLQRMNARPADGGRRGGRVLAALPAALGVTFLLGAGAVAVVTITSTQIFDAEQIVVRQEISAAEGELNALAKPVSTGAADDFAVEVAAVREAGAAVAALQQEYATLLFAGNSEDAGDAGPQLAYEASLAHQSELAPYFAEGTYNATRDVALGETVIDPRYPWFVAYADDDVTVLPPDTALWSLVAVNPATAAGTYTATWVNRDTTTAHLYAWAQGEYDIEREVFVDLTVGKTTLGDHSATEAQKARK